MEKYFKELEYLSSPNIKDLKGLIAGLKKALEVNLNQKDTEIRELKSTFLNKPLKIMN